MLSELEQVPFGERRDEPFARLDEPALAEDEVAVDELVEGRFLAGILAVAQPLLDALAGILVGDLPGALAVDERLVAARSTVLRAALLFFARRSSGATKSGSNGRMGRRS